MGYWFLFLIFIVGVFSNSGVINVIAALEKVLKGKEPRNNHNNRLNQCLWTRNTNPGQYTSLAHGLT